MESLDDVSGKNIVDDV